MALLKKMRIDIREERGLATVEMAIVSLLLMLLTFGGMEYGWLFYRMQEISNVSREAVRQAVLPTSTGASVTDHVTTMMDDFGMGSASYTLTITPSDITSVSPQNPIKVTISVPYDDVGLTGLAIFPTPANISSSATMSREGP